MVDEARILIYCDIVNCELVARLRSSAWEGVEQDRGSAVPSKARCSDRNGRQMQLRMILMARVPDLRPAILTRDPP